MRTVKIQRFFSEYFSETQYILWVRSTDYTKCVYEKNEG